MASCSPSFTYTSIDITLSSWNISTEVYELVNQFQRLAVTEEMAPFYLNSINFVLYNFT